MSLFEEDPAADFLSREQEAIGDVLGGDNFELIADNPAADQGLGELSLLGGSQGVFCGILWNALMHFGNTMYNRVPHNTTKCCHC